MDPITEVIPTNFRLDVATRLRDEYGITTFVETGTGAGYNTRRAAALFHFVYSIEIDSARFRECQEKLADLPNVVVLGGDSAKVLRSLSADLAGTAVMYWLDAHWCGGDRYGPECPLLRELNAVGSVFSCNQVVLIDDARMFTAPPQHPHRADEWPTLTQIQHCVATWPVPCQPLSIVDDVIYILPVR